MKKCIVLLLTACVLVVALVGCGPKKPAQVTTITVWDYYGTSTPIQPSLIAAFEAANPDIKVAYEALTWDTLQQKFGTAMATNTAPDVATVDMTWVPSWAALGGFSDLTALSGGQLNGVPFDQAFTAGALDAMTYEGKVVTILYDFDVYCLYYRADIFEQKGLSVPTTWDELVTIGQQLAEDSDGDGTPDKYLYAYYGDTFRWAQFIYENGSSILNADNTAAAFNDAAGVEATQFLVDITNQYKFAYNLGGEEFMTLAKDGTIGMYSDGPYIMGVLKSGAPEMAGQWKVATHPYSAGPGSYLGGTGLSIPAGAVNKEAAWKFIQFAMQLDNAIGVYTYAGAAPGLKAALEDPRVSIADPYFGDQVTLPIFLNATATAHHYPYVAQWSEIATLTDEAVAAALIGDVTVQEALDNAAEQVNALLQQ